MRKEERDMSNEVQAGTRGAPEDICLLDALHEAQAAEGYLSIGAIRRLADRYRCSSAEVYDCASFYSMFRFEPDSAVRIQICRGAPCHVSGAAEVIRALEEELGIPMGGRTPDGAYSLEYTECVGQCGAAPSLLVNGRLYTDMTAEKARKLIKTGGVEA